MVVMFARLRRSAAAHRLVTDSFLAVGLAVLVVVGALARSAAHEAAAGGAWWVFFAVAALPLVLRHRNPYLCLGMTFGLSLVGYILVDPIPPFILPTAVALYSVGTVAKGRTALLIVGVSLLIAVGLAFITDDDLGITRALTFELAWVISALALGFAVANRRAYVEQIRQRALQAERTKEEEAQKRVAEERMRIARDVHDGVAHALASISIQAGAGSAVLETDPEAALQAFRDIRAASSSALSELRSTLGLLRRDTEEPVEGMGREQVEHFASLLRAEGIRVRLVGERSQWNVGGQVGVALHRILQESLTNVLRHAGASEVEIVLHRTTEEVVLVVTDDGRGVAAGAEETRGYGLVGMRERATLLGGSVDSGPRPGGGFQVKATLPLVGGS